MEQSISRILVETAVKAALKNIKDSPERGIRNLVDMALQCSEGRFQRQFFSTAQTMLQNETSAYYGLVKDIVANTDTNRLLTFGMNLGYNACTIGARHIRENEKALRCNIPWTIALQIEPACFSAKQPEYHRIIQQGEQLGVYAWMLFSENDPQALLRLAKAHSDSAFCIFCTAQDITADFVDQAAELYNIMLVVRYNDSAAAACTVLRHHGLLYSLWYPYGQNEISSIINRNLFVSAQQLSPLFTVLLPKQHCPRSVQRLAHQAVQCARNEQVYRTILWEMHGDTCLIDSIISDDACSAYFDENGNLYTLFQQATGLPYNLFHTSLAEIFIGAFPKDCT